MSNSHVYPTRKSHWKFAGIFVVVCTHAAPIQAQSRVRDSAAPPVVVTPPTVAATTPESEARLAFETGVSFANEERWGEALRSFQRSVTLVPRPNAAFNVATTLVRLGRHIDAVAAFQQYLALADQNADGARMQEAQRQMALEQSKVAHLRLTVSPANASLRVDGRVLTGTGATRDVPMDPGQHEVEVSSELYETYRSVVAPGVGEVVDRSINLARISWGLLEIQTSVPQARVTLDAQTFSTVNGAARVAVGPHRVRASATDFETVERAIVVQPAQHLRMDLVLQREQRGILSRPWFWGIVGGTALAITGIVTIVALNVEPPPFQSSTGIVVQGLGN